MNSFLANLRFVSIPSENFGQDWFELSHVIDTFLTTHGMDLSEETIYIQFTHSPSDILEQHGQCSVARAVIGPKKAVPAPFQLTDWVAAPVWRKTLKGDTFTEILESAEEAHSKLASDQEIMDSFMISIRRELKTELILSIEAIFRE